MTPSIIPNRDSIPQNHPSPKDAVSNLDGAAISMGGIFFSMVVEGPTAFDFLGTSGSMAWENAPPNSIKPNRNKNHLMCMSFDFIIVIFLSWEAGHACQLHDKN
jgi:hypothetical protein